MANTTYFGWETPDDTDLVKDGAAAIRTLGQAIDTSLQDLEGGTTGQILSKTSNTDMDFTWITNDVGDITAVTAGTGISGGGTTGAVTITNSMATEIAAKGDLIVGTGSATFDNLTVGANDTVLTADSSTATGLKWAAPAGGGGKVLQVVQDVETTTFTTTSSSFVDSNLSVSITPSSATSKVLVMLNCYQIATGTTVANGQFNLVRDSTEIDRAGVGADGVAEFISGYTLTNLDSPATTSSITYKVQVRKFTGTVGYEAVNGAKAKLILMEIGA